MSQRECAGFNWPPLSIAAAEPISVSPKAVSRTGIGSVHIETVCRLLSVLPAGLFPFCAGVPAIGVGQPVIDATCGSATATFRPSGARPVALNPSNDCDPIALPTVGVGQPHNVATRGTVSSRDFPSRRTIDRDRSPVSFQSRALGVGLADSQPVGAVADMRGADARRRERDTPEGVTHAFQVSVYKVDPSIRSLARNLFSKDD
jgi:hypothetical protein